MVRMSPFDRPRVKSNVRFEHMVKALCSRVSGREVSPKQKLQLISVPPHIVTTLLLLVIFGASLYSHSVFVDLDYVARLS